MNTFLNSLDFRFATKVFDKDKKVNASDLQDIKDAIRLSPSSHGLQPYKVLIIESQDLKDKLRKSSFDQPQISDCSHLFVFVAKANLQKRISDYCDLAGFKEGSFFDRVKFEAGARAFFGLDSMDKEKSLRISSNQTYIALGFALAACAEKRIDACPMEGFIAKDYAETLNLKDDEYAAVVMAVGYRKDGPAFEKIRFTEEDLFTDC